jgi:hypothetical protein
MKKGECSSRYLARGGISSRWVMTAPRRRLTHVSSHGRSLSLSIYIYIRLILSQFLLHRFHLDHFPMPVSFTDERRNLADPTRFGTSRSPWTQRSPSTRERTSSRTEQEQLKRLVLQNERRQEQSEKQGESSCHVMSVGRVLIAL